MRELGHFHHFPTACISLASSMHNIVGTFVQEARKKANPSLPTLKPELERKPKKEMKPKP
jgi:hypothetical protein